MVLIDLQKAYDSVDRDKMLDIIQKRAKGKEERWMADMVRALHQNNEIEIGGEIINVKYGVA